MKRIAVACVLSAAAILVLAGCDNKKPGNGASNVQALTTKIAMGNGQSATINSAVPADLPAYAKLYAGANIMSTIHMPKAGGMPASVMIIYTVPAKTEDVLGFYKKLSADAGFDTTFDKKVGPTTIFKGQAKQGDNYVAANITEAGGQTTVNLSYN